MMNTNRHRAAELPASPPSRRAGRCRSAALAAALAVLMLGTTAAVAAPTFKAELNPLHVAAGLYANPTPLVWFNNAGTNPKFTAANFSTMNYYDASSTSLRNSGKLGLKVKTAAELNAMDSPPSNPFTVTIDVTMTNDEGETATGTISVKTAWAKAAGGPTPSLLYTEEYVSAGFQGVLVVDNSFSNAGTNPRFTAVSYSTLDYYVEDETGISDSSPDYLEIKAKTTEELGAMSPAPSNPFTVEVIVTMENDENHTVTDTIDVITYW